MHDKGNVLFSELHDETLSTLVEIEDTVTNIYPLSELLAEISSTALQFYHIFDLDVTDPDNDQQQSITVKTKHLESLSKRLDTLGTDLDPTQFASLQDSLTIMISIGHELAESPQSYLRLQLFNDTNAPLREIQSATSSIRRTLKKSTEKLTDELLKRTFHAGDKLSKYNDYTLRSFYLLLFSGGMLVLLAIGSRMTFLRHLRKRLELLSEFANDIAAERYRATPFSTRDPAGLLGIHLWLMGRRIRSALQQARHEQARADNALTKVEELAYFDPLTGLENRRLFLSRLEEALQEENIRKNQPVLFYFDLDNFKEINDSIGHGAGDELLVAISRRLHPIIRQRDSFGRLGGDEFALLSFDQPDKGIQLAERLNEQFIAPFKIAGHDVFSSISMGIVELDQPGKKPLEVLKEADLAMYRAKDIGHASYVHFSANMRDEAEQNMVQVRELRNAINEHQLQLYFQPQFSIDGSRVLGAEALIRWQHPQRGLIMPNEFIGLAENSGLIIPIGDWVLFEGCRAARRIADSGFEVRVAINISSRQFYQSDLIERITLALDESGIEASLLELEITESMLLEDIDEATRVLKQIKALEVHIALDDFGTGYSSLNYLTRLPIDTVKIDRGFISDMFTHPKNKAVVETIIALGHRLGLSVVAEGIETEAQARFLAQCECDIYQGYLFGKPAELEELINHPTLQSVPDYSHIKIQEY